MSAHYDRLLEERALRQSGILGRGGNMGNTLYAISYEALPPEAKWTIRLIINGGPFPNPQDGTRFGNFFGDLPSRGEYLEFTVETPGLLKRGMRRIVAHKNGVLFFTACHYERVPGCMSKQMRICMTLEVDERWRNGFYVITMPLDLRNRVSTAVKRMRNIVLLSE